MTFIISELSESVQKLTKKVMSGCHSEHSQRASVFFNPTIPLGHCVHKCSVIITEVNKPWLENNPAWSIPTHTHIQI